MKRIKKNKLKYWLQYILTLVFLVNSLGVSFGESRIAHAQQDFDSVSDRYIIFLGGILSKSSEDKPIDGRFDYIQNYLEDNLGISRFIYFSYSAINSFPLYCSGWGDDNCSNERGTYLDLIDLSDYPVYTQEDTQQSIIQQANVIEWLIDQVVKKDPNAKIDLVGFSLGGIVSSYWAANIGKDSSLRDHVHSIIILESPVGGIPGAEAFLNCGIADLICKGWQTFFLQMWGKTVLRELQVEIPGNDIDGSIINELSQAPNYIPLTSIQSTTDYCVNGESFPLRFISGITDSTPIGIGSQALVGPVTWHHNENLGGEIVTDPVLITDLIKGLFYGGNIIMKNHGAPLDEEQTARWIAEAIKTPTRTEIPSNSSTAMLFDVSGSMGEDDATGITKIDAAKNSGDRILDIIQAENSVSQGAEIGILSFSNGAWVNAYISSDVISARSALDGLYPLNGTGMPDGLRLAIDQLAGTQYAKPIIIMLSDGLPNVPLGASGNLGDADLARQQSLDLASEASSKGICIYTVGFGIPYIAGSISGEASIDEDFLKQIAANSGCGAYYNAQNATELANVYVSLRHESTGNILLRQTGNISQDETIDIGNVQVPDNQSMILFTLNWPGSQLDAILTDPAGKVVDSNYPESSFSLTGTLASIIIQQPQPGEWKVAAQGVDVPEGTTSYNAVLSVRPNPAGAALPTTVPTAPGFPIVILLLVAAGGGIALYVMVQTRERSRAKTPVGVLSAQLIGISGEKIGQAVPIQDRLLIGRGSGCKIRLSDRTVSRQHVVFRFANGQWFIQDLNSQSGTYVNNVKVQATTLKDGDRTRIGSSVFEFRVTR